MKKPLRLYIHPFFFLTLLQKCRHGELEEATAIAANEFLIAAREFDRASKKTTAVDAFGDDGGLLLLPTLQRQRELGLFVPPPQDPPQESDHGPLTPQG